MRPVVARAVVPLPRDALYEQLADLRDHWKLADRWVEPLELDADGGVVRLQGPLGLTRTVRTELRERVPGERLAGVAAVGATTADISWSFASAGDGTAVTLRADVMRATVLDRLVLALGGRRWLSKRFAETLNGLV